MDAAGSINTTSQNLPGSVQKTNFWDINPATGNTFVFDLFGGNPPADMGLLGQSMPGVNAPYTANEDQPFGHYDADFGWFSAEGVPILPVDDAGQANAYPLMQVTASDKTSGQALASLDIVLPVASEADCQNCHALGEIGADSNRRPGVDFIFPDDINDPNDVLQAAKVNILRLHDNKHGTDIDNQRPVLCAGCHYSAALDLAGNGGPVGNQLGHAMMSQVMHGHHGELRDPATDQLIFPENGTLEETCYQCHPGKVTKCLRGAMGGAGITCQNCHGGMLAVGGVHNLPVGGSLDGANDGTTPRRPWIDEPRCESCHTGDSNDHLGDTIRLSQTWESADPSATPRRADNKRFAENPAKLYRNSLGHGGVACEGCHGSTHAIWPNALPGSNDNVAAEQLQGHAGTISECSSCHTTLGLTLEGPHGMHNVNSPAWTEGHESFYKQDPGSCRACHGQNLEGTALSRTATDRDLQTDANGQIHLVKGTEVSCTLCHARP
ncbi:cytochrome C [bacterium endosymbiont of Escarpia laminata]|nr:MAG: cytochrome C [bacterium endosymbiont of Escarpia laminata]